MVTAKDIQGVMAMMPAFATKDAGDLRSPSTIDVDNLQSGVNRIIKDGVDIVTTTGSFGECYNLFWDEYKTLAVRNRGSREKTGPRLHWEHKREPARSRPATEVRARHRRRRDPPRIAVL